MSDCTELLGISPDATLQEIKRAYARALKVNRPDDDPEAFGLVHAAFEACLARFKRKKGGLYDEPDWFDGEDGYEDEMLDSSAAGPSATQAAMDVEPPDQGVRVEVSQAVDTIFEAAEAMRPSDFVAWLRSDERLYDLAFKGDVGDLVIERTSEYANSLPWRTLAAIHQFFEVDSISDPRLRRDYEARQVWLRVEADARFARSVQAKRNPNVDFADRIVLEELLDPPDRIRHLKMHLIPTLPGQLRNRFKELSIEDPERAEAAVSLEARGYWLPLTDPATLHPRRVALALAHCTLVALPLGLLLAAPDFGWRRMAGMWGAIVGVFFSIWLVRALFSLATTRYSAWRMRTVGAGEAPAGSNILADKATVLAGASAVLSLALAGIALRLDKVTMGIIVQIWLIMLMFVTMCRAPRFRWEAVLASLAITVIAYSVIRQMGSASLQDAFYAVGPGAFATGVLVVVFLDAMHARFTRQALSDIRDAVSIPQCILAIATTLVAWLT